MGESKFSACSVGLEHSYQDINIIRGSLKFESPVSIEDAKITGRCVIGQFSYCNENCKLSNVSIGRFCSIASGVVFGGGQHPTNWLSSHPFVYDGSSVFSKFNAYKSIAQKNSLKELKRKVRVTVGNDVWIGEGANIMQGVTIGDGAIIGARSVVTKDVPPYSIAVGVPAKVVKYRFDKLTIDNLLEIKWWDYDISNLSEVLNYKDIQSCIKILFEHIENQSLSKLSVRKYQLLKGELIEI